MSTTAHEFLPAVSFGWVKMDLTGTTTHDVWETPTGRVFPCPKGKKPMIELRGGVQYYEGLRVAAVDGES